MLHTRGNTKIYRVLSKLSTIKWSIAVKSIYSGLFAGLLVVFYRFAIEYGTETAIQVYAVLRRNPLMILPWIILIGVTGFLIAWFMKQEPMAKGSGIPQVEGLLLYGLKIKWHSVLLVRFIAGIISSFFGLSLGREGPSIQIGASGSQALAKHISKNKLEENYLITGGAAAGLSAAFNAPLSGIVFALEEVHRSFSGLILIAATTAALTADLVSKYFFGLDPVLSFTETPSLSQVFYIWLIPLGILSGIVGAGLNKALLVFQTLYGKIPYYLCPGIALLIALPCGLFLPEVLGGGQNLVQIAEKAHSGISVIALYLVVKFLFTCTSFGSGTPGGIFMPILAVGALTGSLLGLVAMEFGLPEEYIPDFAVCAMAGALSGSVKAPVTSILLIAEMTGSLTHMLPVAACSFIALFLSDLLKTTPIYEALLERIVEKDQSNQNDKLGGMVEVPVEMGSAVANRKVREINWPDGTLLVGIHRGNKDIVPNGNTQIFHGDYLIVLSTENTYKDLNINIQDLCYANRTD
ncbi:MAG: ClC family H(+)/Cl(-) exchange transporter [Clostridia bacterium]|nr:ClC family H(+)/Cl(-) exchange transporter [Clostridia bacterium]